MTHPVQHEADDDLGASSASVPPDSACACRDGRSAPSARSPACAARSSPVPCAGATDRGPSGTASVLGVAVASAATDSVEAEVCTVGDLRIVFLRLVRIVLRHHPIGIFGFGRHFLRQFGFLDLGLLLGERRRRDRRIGVRARRQIGGFEMRRCHLQPDLDRRRARRIVGIVVRADARPPARRRRHEAQARPPPRKSTAAGKAFVRCRGRTSRISAAQGLRVWGFRRRTAMRRASGTPSSATSLIFA